MLLYEKDNSEKGIGFIMGSAYSLLVDNIIIINALIIVFTIVSAACCANKFCNDELLNNY